MLRIAKTHIGNTEKYKAWVFIVIPLGLPVCAPISGGVIMNNDHSISYMTPAGPSAAAIALVPGPTIVIDGGHVPSIQIYSHVDSRVAWLLGFPGLRPQATPYAWIITDVTSDAYPDIIATQGASDGASRVMIYSGASMSAYSSWEQTDGFAMTFAERVSSTRGGASVLLLAESSIREPGRGRVRVVEAASGRILVSSEGSRRGSNCYFGMVARFLGDIDGDGIEDILTSDVVVDQRERQGGLVIGLSGRNAEPLFSIAADSGGSAFGARLAIVGDVDGDGARDFVVSEPFRPRGEPAEGAIYLYSARRHELLKRIVGPQKMSLFGSELEQIGDVDGDGVPDVIIIAEKYSASVEDWSQEGAVAVYSLRTGEPIWMVVGPRPRGKLGYYGIQILPDIDHDGVLDVCINGVMDTLILSGRTGERIGRVPGR